MSIILPPCDGCGGSGSCGTVDKFTNDTVVPDYASPPGADIAPYYQPSPSGSIPGCGTANPCGGSGQPDCGPWVEPVPDNTFSVDGTIDPSPDGTVRGFKNVQAMKWWHGRWGFKSSNYFGPDSMTVWPDATAPNAKGQIMSECRSEVSSPDETHYLTLDVACSVVVTGDAGNGHGGARTVTASSTMTVAEASGVRIGSGTVPTLTGDDATYIPDLFTKAAENVHSVFGIFKDVINDHVLAGDIGGTLTLANSGTQYKWTWAYSGGEKIWEITVDAIAGTFRDEQWFYDTPTTTGSTLNQHSYELWTLGSASLVYTSFLDVITDLSPYVQTLTCTADLSDPYTGANLQEDIEALLGTWFLTDDCQYPWRTDDYTTIGPLVRNHEVQNVVEPIAIATNGSYTDPNAANYTGEVLGGPLAAGYTGYFNFRQEVWRECGSGTWYVQGYGENVPAYIPQNSTCWTNYKQAWDWGSRGGFVKHYPGVRVAQKWAEVVQEVPAINFFRPCGSDRVAFVEATVRCIDSLTGTSPKTVNTATSQTDPDIVTGDICIVCGTVTTSDGIWEVTRTAAKTYELTTFVSDLPSDHVCDRPGTGTFGKVRWPNAWAVCGRVLVSAATNASPIVITLATGQPNLRTGDSLDISGAVGNTNANGTHVVTRVSDTSFELDSTTGNGTFSGTCYAESTGAPDHVWNTTASNGDFVFRQWGFNFRDLGEYRRRVDDGCLTPTTEPRADQFTNGLVQEVTSITCTQSRVSGALCGSVEAACITPNGELFGSGTCVAFTNPSADDIYGDQWQADIVWSMNDPFWTAPAVPCDYLGAGVTWTEDDGTCNADAAPLRYYPRAPQVEPRCSEFSGAPTVPADVYLGCLDAPDVDVSGTPDGNICPPPVSLPYLSGGAPDTIPTPTSVYRAAQFCVCEEGRFEPEYTEAGVVCYSEYVP